MVWVIYLLILFNLAYARTGWDRTGGFRGGIAPAVWGVALSGLTTPGTTGKKLKDSLTTAKFIALK